MLICFAIHCAADDATLPPYFAAACHAMMLAMPRYAAAAAYDATLIYALLALLMLSSPMLHCCCLIFTCASAALFFAAAATRHNMPLRLMPLRRLLRRQEARWRRYTPCRRFADGATFADAVLMPMRLPMRQDDILL